MIGTWDVGTQLTLVAQFRNDNHQPADPTTTRVWVQRPDGSYETNGDTLSGDGSGRFARSVTPDQDGVWTFRFAGVGAVTVTRAERFRIRPLAAPGESPP